MKVFLSIVQILVCIALVSVVLMQHRKSGGFTGMFGGGGTQADSSGSWQRMSGLNKITVGVSAVFMFLSLVLVAIR